MVKGRWSVLPSPLSLPQDETTGPDWFPPYSLPLGTAKAKATQKEGRRKEQHGNTTNLLSSSLKAQLKALRSPRFALRVLVSRRLVSRLPWRRTSRRSRASSCRTRACRRGKPRTSQTERRSSAPQRERVRSFVRSFGTVASRGESEVWFTFANLTRTRAWGSGQALSLAHLTMITNTHKHKQTNRQAN